MSAPPADGGGGTGTTRAVSTPHHAQDAEGLEAPTSSSSSSGGGGGGGGGWRLQGRQRQQQRWRRVLVRVGVFALLLVAVGLLLRWGQADADEGGERDEAASMLPQPVRVRRAQQEQQQDGEGSNDKRGGGATSSQQEQGQGSNGGRDNLPPFIIPNATTASGATTADSPTDPRGLPTTLGLDSGRPAQVVLPRHIPQGAKLPLVMVLHGWGSNGSHHDAYLGVSARVDDFGGFFALLPDGMRNSKGYRFWNAPACCNRENMAVDDLGYLTDLLAEAVQRLPADPDRLFLVGHSNGGQMALYLACRTDTIRGLVSIAGFGLPPECRVPRPCTALIVHGTEDLVVPYDLSPKVFTTWAEGQVCLPASKHQETRDYDCDGDAAPGPDPRYDEYRDPNCGQTGNETIVTEYTSCANNQATVTFWEMEGAAHTPAFSPKATDDMLEVLLGPKDKEHEQKKTNTAKPKPAG